MLSAKAKVLHEMQLAFHIPSLCHKRNISAGQPLYFMKVEAKICATRNFHVFFLNRFLILSLTPSTQPLLGEKI